jgi:hypothetical protein
VPPSWIGKAWAGLAAVVIGVLAASVVSGSAPPASLLGVLPIAAVLIVLGPRRRTRYRRRAREEASDAGWTIPSRSRDSLPDRRNRSGPGDSDGRTSTPVASQIGRSDWGAVDKIRDSLSDEQVRWLSSCDYTTPWLDTHVRPVMRLRPLLADAAQGPLPPDVVGALRSLADAVEHFLHFYASNTLPDPVLLGDEWRFFDWESPYEANASSADGHPWSERAAQMQKLSLAVVNAYRTFTAAALRQPPAAEGKRARPLRRRS